MPSRRWRRRRCAVRPGRRACRANRDPERVACAFGAAGYLARMSGHADRYRSVLLRVMLVQVATLLLLWLLQLRYHAS